MKISDFVCLNQCVYAFKILITHLCMLLQEIGDSTEIHLSPPVSTIERSKVRKFFKKSRYPFDETSELLLSLKEFSNQNSLELINKNRKKFTVK
ncbi:hypothetical protein BpHYR1_036736 [Brachionus plicatilis]|uniref:Uncharacterized protein n=1 Tax=Brachionus plicatilis TaxID=10195 RepID=A0A3M7PI14_BRAPC|nr:hypothetical protein BpHYR1_036736 [Brachionus plicatilis]